jgi:transcription elongation factor GreA
VSGLAERTDRLLVTADGYARLHAEFEELRTDGRREVSERVEGARNDGDLADNPTLYDVLEEQAQLERRIALLEAQLAGVRIADPPADGAAGVGCYVRVRDESTRETSEYELVGAIEGDVGDGRVTVDAPVGRALAGRHRGQTVEVETPRGLIRLHILEVHDGVHYRYERKAA